MSRGFELLDHSSDVGIRAWGASREEALVEASMGLVSILVDPQPLREVEERTFVAGGSDEEEQIVNWLNEILFYFDTDGVVFSRFVIDSWDSTGIHGRAFGERLDPERHELRTAVKAVTYHQFASCATKSGWEIRVFVDV